VPGLFTSRRLLGQVDLYGVTEMSNWLIDEIVKYGHYGIVVVVYIDYNGDVSVFPN